MKRSKLVSILFMISALAVSANAALAHHTPVSRGNGGDIIVFDIVDSVDDDSHSSDLVDGGHDDSGEGRPAGGGGGGDIVVFDILGVEDRDADRPAGGGGGDDIIVFDIIDSAHDDTSEARPAGGGGGGNIIVFDIVDS